MLQMVLSKIFHRQKSITGVEKKQWGILWGPPPEQIEKKSKLYIARCDFINSGRGQVLNKLTENETFIHII